MKGAMSGTTFDNAPDYTVRVLWASGVGGDKWPHLLDSRQSLAATVRLAKTLREVFGCAAWVELFDQPANLPIIRVRQSMAEKKALLMVPA